MLFGSNDSDLENVDDGWSKQANRICDQPAFF